MLSLSKLGASLSLLLVCVKGTWGSKKYHDNYEETIIKTTTVWSPTTVPVTHHVNVTVPHYVDVTIPHYVNTTLVNTVTKVVTTCITESTTKTLHITTAVTKTQTNSTSVTDTLYYTVSETDTELTSVTNTLNFTVSTTETDLATVTVTNTDTETSTSTVPATITTYTTRTVFSTTYDPCPKSCSISAASVTLYFWPTDRPYTYPSTWVDEDLGYTFVSPSVYMMVPSAAGINTEGERAGPATSSWIIPLDLEEVSTIDGSATKQLTLSHLGTDCPKTAEPSEIATIPASCNPVLAAPSQVRSWAYPCNACGRFGLFDPPYAVSPVTGLFETTTVVAEPIVTVSPIITSDAPAAPSDTPVEPSEAPVPTSVIETTDSTPNSTPPNLPTSASEPSSSGSALPTSVVPALANRMQGGISYIAIGFSMIIMLIS